MSPARSKISQY